LASSVPELFPIPIVAAPMAGGPSTPELVAAVGDAGGLGFLGAGYRTSEQMAQDVARVRALTRKPFGVNVFAAAPTDAPGVEDYARRLRAAGLEPGAPRSDDDGLAEKVERLVADPVAVVSFTFAAPPAELVARLQRAGSRVWVTVTAPGEARAAARTGADALVVQGVEAGGHRASFDDAAPGRLGLLALLQLVDVGLPLIATGGIATGAAIAAVLAAGAEAAQLGTAFMRCPEAATSPAHRAALATPAPTALTRAFSGRTARAIENAFMREHGEAAPAAYPAVHHLTAPIRARAREAGDAGLINLWAGEAHELAREQPAGELVRELWAQARAAAARLQQRLP
jgi:nitronate monooxygenase